VKSLISDIESMQYHHESWFGPFTEMEENESMYGDVTVSVEWPNLRISLDAVQAELNKLPPVDPFMGSQTLNELMGTLDG
jgi:hypothetical protein